MAHQYDKNRNASLWAGQSGGSSQQWPDAYVKKNPQTLIREFNEDLPSHPESDFGQSPSLYVNGAKADFSDLPFDALFGTSFEKHDIGIGAGGPGSCGPSRTISHASSNGRDDLESLTFSQPGDDLYNDSFGDGIFNHLNSPAPTTYSETIVSRDASLEGSPAMPRRPFLHVQTDTGSMSGNAMGYSAASSPASAHGFPTGSFNSQNTPTSAPRQSRAINHLSLDGTRRIRRELPRGFPLDGLITTLARVRYDFDFRVYQDDRPAYTLDLPKCYDYLLTLKSQVSGTDRSLRNFIDKELPRIDSKSDEWEACMSNVTIGTDPLAQLCTLNNMPSRVRYAYVRKNDFSMQERYLDPESPVESDNLMLAAQLSRIICRKVEVKGYAHLQRLLHKSDSLSEAELLPFLQRLGRILLTLRWRSSWWSVMLGNTFINGEDEMMTECQHRVKTLCRVLYFYYCSVRRKLATWSTVKSLRGVLSKYQDTDCEVSDDFPGDETVEAFEGWMARGQQLVFEAGVPRVLGSMGLPA
ncbi:hypothetical protein CkaCkLH20_02486 [Colletotrichum karsti]|uniref:Uncharacterized protein n=1 Tax=Colletotrichum karsti TaxID=1095194 RepID=A0A9P6LNK3_9PEZI|nr:uncharacterized protein CkaCkLH20_02486 [Colletotrichum karsti]KAF9879675.1 hypothetical protein CkaCkLH20_02486 [Colletotrichum karsti]